MPPVLSRVCLPIPAYPHMAGALRLELSHQILETCALTTYATPQYLQDSVHHFPLIARISVIVAVRVFSLYIYYTIFFLKNQIFCLTRDRFFYKNQDTLFYFLNLLYRLSYLPMVGRVGLEPTTRASLKQNKNKLFAGCVFIFIKNFFFDYVYII